MPQVLHWYEYRSTSELFGETTVQYAHGHGHAHGHADADDIQHVHVHIKLTSSAILINVLTSIHRLSPCMRSYNEPPFINSDTIHKCPGRVHAARN